MLNKKFKVFLLVIIIIFTAASFLEAEEFESPEAFTEFIYSNYSEQNFSLVYQNFAAELKREFPESDYLEFQKNNFAKYELEYREIEVGSAKEVEFEVIKDKFAYAEDFGSYYELPVSYLLKFNRLGSQERRSEKKVYLRKIVDDFQIFWNPQSALKDENAAEEIDQDE